MMMRMVSAISIFFTGMIMIWHIHRVMHVWCDHMLMIGCIHIFKRVIGISLMVMVGLVIHIVHFVSHPFFQVAISYELHLFHEPIHMKEKNDMQQKNRLFSRENKKQV